MRGTALLLLGMTLLVGCDPPDIEITETPIRVTETKHGRGDPVKPGDRVRVAYRVTFEDGRELLTSESYTFDVGTYSVIQGIDEAVVGMRVGGSIQFTCPPHKHWGRGGYGGGVIPPATDLHITIRLLEIENRANRRVGVASESR